MKTVQARMPSLAMNENTFLLVLDSLSSRQLKSIDWDLVCRNPNLTWNYISTHPSLPWNWNVLASNPCVSYTHLIEHTTNPRDLIEFAQNQNASLEILEEILENCNTQTKKDLFFHRVSKNPNVNREFILKHANEDWLWRDLLKNKNIPLQLYFDITDSQQVSLADAEMFDEQRETWNLPNWNEPRVQNQETEEDEEGSEFDEEHGHSSDEDDDWMDPLILSTCASLTLSDVLAHPEFDWDWRCLSKHENITLSDILAHSELPWKWKYVSGNPNLNLEFVKENLQKSWDWDYLATNPNITIPEIRANSDLPWDIANIHRNPNFTCADATAFHMDPEMMAFNCNLTFGYIKKHHLIRNSLEFLLSNTYRNDWFFSSRFYRNRILPQQRKWFASNVFEDLIAKACTPIRTPNWTDDWGPDHPMWGMI